MLFYSPVQIFMCVVPTVPSVVLTNIFTHLHCSDEMNFPGLFHKCEYAGHFSNLHLLKLARTP